MQRDHVQYTVETLPKVGLSPVFGSEQSAWDSLTAIAVLEAWRDSLDFREGIEVEGRRAGGGDHDLVDGVSRPRHGLDSSGLLISWDGFAPAISLGQIMIQRIVIKITGIMCSTEVKPKFQLLEHEAES